MTDDRAGQTREDFEGDLLRIPPIGFIVVEGIFVFVGTYLIVSYTPGTLGHQYGISAVFVGIFMLVAPMLVHYSGLLEEKHE